MQRFQTHYRLALAASCFALACDTSQTTEQAPLYVEKPCEPYQEAPYANGTPYLGIHANAANNDYVQCETASEYVQVWHALEGLGLTQPATFSPGGDVTYATTSNPKPDGCRLHAVDTENGDVLWCKTYPGTIGTGAVEVDEDGHLYFSFDGTIASLDADGTQRWETVLPAVEDSYDAPWGVHFTPDGHVATVTSSGVVYLLRRHDGEILSSLSIPEVYGFVAPESLDVSIDVTPLLPEAVAEDINSVWGAPTDGETNNAFSALLGAGEFCDNTLGISEAGDIYVIGGGPDTEHGAVVQIRVIGTADEPSLTAGWYTETNGGSATSPSISDGDRWLVVSDGSSADVILDQDAVDPQVKTMDIEACDANTDADPDPERCAVAWEEPVHRWPMIGAPAITDDGMTYIWELGLDFSADPNDRDLVAMNEDGVVWEAALPDDMDWAGVITVTENHLIGTASTVTPSEESIGTFVFPKTTDDAIVVVDRFNGELVWKGELTDDGAATVSVGQDGSLYAGMMGFLSILATEDRPTLGLIRFAPAPE